MNRKPSTFLFCMSEAVADGGFLDGAVEDIGLLRLEERVSRHLPAAFAAGFEAATACFL